ncbi:hypothetical protein C0Q70_03853 [Pomacea canaliculata]|uniref:Carboxylesterase type B domain-containing protein n=1 Tax=Pomacea canaliculata TaxID=400727 RepID=A0A2T7PTV7_POMCA|nr:hypothetical protein C0Q70_03853 [Pomacea canaliculata]
MSPLLLEVLLLMTASSYGDRDGQNTSPSPPPVVQTQLGAISGRMLTAKNGRQYEAFRGIPYAGPPVGDLRFSKPQPHPPFDQGRFDAGEYGNFCLQGASGMLKYRSGNIYNPGVLVTNGSIVVVTLNYRLGVGFLSTGDPTLPGNYGLWDQHLAIQWVKDNIQAFNGDPDKITIGGESAGSASVAFHTLTPLSRGLFARAILQSGTATSSWALQRKPLDQAQKLALNLTCPSPRSSTNFDILRASIQDTTLAKAAVDFVFLPTVDAEFVTKNPADTLNDNEYLGQIGFYERDYLSGCVNNEGASLSIQMFELKRNESLVLNPVFYDLDLVPLLIEQKFGNTSAAAEEVVKFFYTSPRYSELLDKKQVLDTAGDAGFYVPLTEFARAVARGRSSARRNLVYIFDHYPAFVSDGYLGTPHADDLLYEFDIDGLINASLWTADDDRLREVFMSVILDFVKSGNPDGALRSSLQDGWPDFDLINESYLSIKVNSSSIQHHIRPRETSLWLNLLPTLLDSAFGRTNHSSSHVMTLSELIG